MGKGQGMCAHTRQRIYVCDHTLGERRRRGIHTHRREKVCTSTHRGECMGDIRGIMRDVQGMYGGDIQEGCMGGVRGMCWGMYRGVRGMWGDVWGMYEGCMGACMGDLQEGCTGGVQRMYGGMYEKYMRDVLGVYGGLRRDVWGLYGTYMGDVCMYLTHLVRILIKGSLTSLITEGNVFRFLQCFCSLSINLSYVG